jgi:hypothetical protein
MPVENSMTDYSYEIEPRDAELGGGWRLRLLEDGEEVGGGVFPLTGDDAAGMAWWIGASEVERAHWLVEANSARAVDAWIAYQRATAYADAQAQAEGWIGNR